MNLRRLFIGFSVLFLIAGLVAAIWAPGGWQSDWKPTSYAASSILKSFDSLNERIGFAKSTPVPLIGLVSALMGAVALIFIWATARSKG
ncbi:MAG: hypothetical protein ACI8UO_001151 [Verrucomicrobiales bacterium]|jgi:hypothetical protein